MILCVCNKSVIFDCDPEAGKKRKSFICQWSFFSHLSGNLESFFIFRRKSLLTLLRSFRGTFDRGGFFYLQIVFFFWGIREAWSPCLLILLSPRKNQVWPTVFELLRYLFCFAVLPERRSCPGVSPRRRCARLWGRVMARSYPIRTVIQLPIKRTLWP